MYQTPINRTLVPSASTLQLLQTKCHACCMRLMNARTRVMLNALRQAASTVTASFNSHTKCKLLGQSYPNHRKIVQDCI